MFPSNFSLLPQCELIFQYNGIRTSIYLLQAKKNTELYIYIQLFGVLLLSEKNTALESSSTWWKNRTGGARSREVLLLEGKTQN